MGKEAERIKAIQIEQQRQELERQRVHRQQLQMQHQAQQYALQQQQQQMQFYNGNVNTFGVQNQIAHTFNAYNPVQNVNSNSNYFQQPDVMQIDQSQIQMQTQNQSQIQFVQQQMANT